MTQDEKSGSEHVGEAPGTARPDPAATGASARKRVPARKSLVEAREAVLARERSTHAERAVLVAVEFTGERRRLTSAARQARKSAQLTAETGGEEKEGEDGHGADLDFEASLQEFAELARSAGAEVAATLIQRRARPDAATLVGQGKLEEIEGAVLSTNAMWCCSTTI